MKQEEKNTYMFTCDVDQTALLKAATKYSLDNKVVIDAKKLAPMIQANWEAIKTPGKPVHIDKYVIMNEAGKDGKQHLNIYDDSALTYNLSSVKKQKIGNGVLVLMPSINTLGLVYNDPAVGALQLVTAKKEMATIPLSTEKLDLQKMSGENVTITKTDGTVLKGKISAITMPTKTYTDYGEDEEEDIKVTVKLTADEVIKQGKSIGITIENQMTGASTAISLSDIKSITYTSKSNGKPATADVQ